jgi:predicted dehydrogenase
MSNRSTITTAVVGCGYWGKNLVRNFDRLSDLRLCCDTSGAVRASIAASYPHITMTGDYESVVADLAVQAVILATPAPSHAAMAVQALKAGKHVFVEKPLALTSRDARTMVDEAERASRILMVGHLLEYHPAVNYIKGMIDSGELGDVYYVYSQRLNLGKVRSDENALWSLAPHDISVALYLLDEVPDHVEASGQAFLQPGVEDVTFITLRFASGRVAHVHVSWLDPHKERRLTVVGTRRMVVFDDMEPTEKIRVYDKGVDRPGMEAPAYDTYAELLQLREGEIVIPRLPMAEPLALECAEFLQAVETGIPPRSDGYDGLRVVETLEAAQAALARNHVAYGGRSDERAAGVARRGAGP